MELVSVLERWNHRPKLNEVTPAAHGGFLASIILSAAKEHFSTTLQGYQQPDTFDAQLVFLRSATAGRAILDAEDLKLGSRVSTIRVTLSQNGKACVTGHVSCVHLAFADWYKALTVDAHRNMNMRTERGISFPTDYHLTPAPAPADVAKLANGTDQLWLDWVYPWHPKSTLKAFTPIRYFFPIKGVSHPSMTDAWLTPIGVDDVFTAEMIGYIADLYHRMVDNYLVNAEWGTRNIASRILQAAAAQSADTDDGGQGVLYGYPTMSMGLEVKKLLPPEGVKWLFIRAQAKQIKNGRMDAEITILDEKMELVALSHQVSLIIDFAQESKKGQDSMKGKL